MVTIFGFRHANPRCDRENRLLAIAPIAALLLGCIALVDENAARATPANRPDAKFLYARCAACHAVDSNRNMTGPTLRGVVGRAPGIAAGFNYSPAMRKLGGKWTRERLDAFLAAPQKFAPGTRMAFSGLKKAEDRAAIIAFLASSSGPARK